MNAPWRPKTIGEILGQDQGDSPGAKVFRRYLELDINSQEKLRALAAPDQYLWLIYWLYGEVQNGGIDQFLWNSSGEYALETLEALQAVGAAESYRVLKEACDLFPDARPSQDQEIRQDQIRAINAHFEGKHIDDIVDGDLDANLIELLWEYHRTHATALMQ